MKVYAARFYEIYDRKSKELFGRDTPIGMSIMAAAMIFMTIFLFFVMLIPTITEPNVKYRSLGVAIWLILCFFSAYFAYDVYGNYLYYKGIWKEPPFGKSSVRIFWRDVKKGKKPYLLFPERKGECFRYHFIQRGLFRRGVIVEVCDEEMERIRERWINKFEEEKEKIKEVKIRYGRYGIEELRIIYRDGRETRVERKDAELLRFLMYLGGIGYSNFVDKFAKEVMGSRK